MRLPKRSYTTNRMGRPGITGSLTVVFAGTKVV